MYLICLSKLLIPSPCVHLASSSSRLSLIFSHLPVSLSLVFPSKFIIPSPSRLFPPSSSRLSLSFRHLLLSLFLIFPSKSLLPSPFTLIAASSSRPPPVLFVSHQPHRPYPILPPYLESSLPFLSRLISIAPGQTEYQMPLIVLQRDSLNDLRGRDGRRRRKRGASSVK